MDLRKAENRSKIINEINTPENKKRKDESFICSEVYNGRLRQYVIEYLQTLFHRETVSEMPVQSGANLVKRIVSERAKIYTSDKPKRNFEDVSDEQIEVLEKIYKDMDVDYFMTKANEFFVLNNQCMLQVLPKDGKLQLKVLKMHHFDVVVSPYDPTEMIGVVISSYDKKFKRDDHGNFNPLGTGSISSPNSGTMPDGVDQSIADEDDTGPNVYEVWTKEFFDVEKNEMIPALQFVMDKDGTILSSDPLSPIPILPFCDVSGFKDHQFYAENAKSLTDFCIEYNALQSEIAQAFRMASFSQAILQGPESLLPRDSDMKIGPNRILVLKTDSEEGEVNFSYASPGGQVSQGIEYSEMLLAQFLSCNGIDPKVVSKESGQTYASGIERLLAMVERFQATRNDYTVMEKVEHQLFKILKAYLEAYQNTDVLDVRYNMPQLSDYCSMSIQYSKPEGASTFKEKIETQEKLMSLGLASRTTVVKNLYNFTHEEAEEYIAKIDEEKNTSLQLLALQQNQTQNETVEEIDNETEEADQTDKQIVNDDLGEAQSEVQVEKDVVLNGAQVTSMIGVVSKVAIGELPRSSGLSILITAFGLTEERALEIMGDAGLGFKIEEK